MVEMWDNVFAAMNPLVDEALRAHRGAQAFELMHQELDKVWHECARVLKPGGIACINIGDAVRTIASDFQMYANHVRIVQAMLSLGLTQLPDILWRKQTNAPNKFMGSGMLPAGAYVTYEHEYILIFRKGSRRSFHTAAEKHNRRRSAFFWEERNQWFSDVWSDLKGTAQGLTDIPARQRSGAYPFELAYRLVCMLSVYGDVVLDPFLGTATTAAACIAAGRNSTGIESDSGVQTTIQATMVNAPGVGRRRIAARLEEHRQFVDLRREQGLAVKHHNAQYDCPVMTSQETEIAFYLPCRLNEVSAGYYEVAYESTEATIAGEPNPLRYFETPDATDVSPSPPPNLRD